MTPVLEFQNIARSFTRGKPVLKDVSFQMAPGEVVGLLGRNGAGKTTLIRIAMGMLFPHAGSVRLFGLSPVADGVAVKKRVGYVAEDQVLPQGSSISELTELHRYLFPNWDHVLEGELLERFGLDPACRIKTLSKGQARQVALLCAVCHRPELLILDEPAGGLDPAARREFLETSIQLLNREGSSILFSSHHMTDVERIGGRVILLDQGKVRLDRDLDRLREEVCVAMLPRGSAADAGTLEHLPGCLNARPVFDDWHAVFDGTPEAVERQIRQSLGVDGTRCVRVPLEELFIEMVGSDR
ncbi:MAG TPA: ABC transporter ATP-binding protein [Candidatus Sulfopaludibacter sp.]|jgi:ABC-2 type transport system ATP-binding protein|nr:ABC transporter ATP-binding protein [Candidatus Sulfopaludibacter sp.]